MAQAPLILSKQNFGGLQALPSLSQGERLLQAETAGAQAIASADINAAQREAAVDVSGSRAITEASSRSDQAIVAFAGAVDRNANSLTSLILDAQHQTRRTEAQTNIIKRQDAARDEYRNDGDWETAPRRFQDKLSTIESEELAGFGAQDRTAIQAATLRSSLALKRDLDQTALGKMNNAALASQTELSTSYLQRAGRATSAAERDGIIAENDQGIDSLVSKGILEPTQALSSKQAFRLQLDQTDLYKGIKSNPAATIAQLDDPKSFPSLTPLQRETARQQAQAALDEAKGLEAQDLQKRDPTAAAATYMRDPTPGAIGDVVRRALIPGESGGNPNAESSQNAAGIAQIVPDTARRLARSLGWNDLDGLDDAGVKAWLKANPGRSVAMAEKEIGDAWKRYGNLAAAFAAYHAGPGGKNVEGANDWHRKATELYGPGYTAAQFISVIPEGRKDANMTTRDYVAGMLARAGADPGRGGVSPNAAFRIAGAVEAGARRDQAEQLTQINRLVTLSADNRDAVIESFKSGYATDPQQIAAVKLPLIAAASAGDATAIQKLRQFTELEQIAPVVRQAYQLPPAVLEAETARLKADIAVNGATPAALRNLQVFEAVQGEVAKQRTENPVGLIERSGRQPVTAVTLPAEGLPGNAPDFAQGLSQRNHVVADAARIYGGEIKPFKPEEAARLKQGWEQAGPQTRFDTLRAMSRELSPAAYEAGLSQIAGDDQLARMAGRLGARNPELGKAILKGQVLMEAPGVKPKAEEVRAALAAKMPSDVFDPKTLTDLTSAALAVYVAERAGQSALFEPGDAAALEKAIESVTGKMVKRNGVRVPLPDGLKPGQFEHVMDSLSPADLGGVPTGQAGQALDMDYIRSRGRLRPNGLGDGLYLVTLPGANGKDAAVMSARNGLPLVIDLKAIAAGKTLPSGGDTVGDIRRQTIVDGVNRLSAGRFGQQPQGGAP